MPKSKKLIPVEEVEVEQEEQEVAEAPKFPYLCDLKNGHKVMVVAESEDAAGRTVLHTAEGVSYHAPIN